MRTKRVLIWAMIAVVALTSSFALATTQRTFVSASGVDNSTCSLNSPCRTFAAAMSATNANGEIIVLESAGYGPVTITKSVSIIAPAGIYGAITVFSGNGITINAPGATVVLRGLTINGQGGSNGILAQHAARVRVEGCVVSNMGAVAIYHTAPSAEMIVLDTIVRDNVDGLGLVASNGSILLDHVRSERNQNSGFYIATTAPGEQAKAGIFDSLFAYNGAHGIWADTTGSADTIVQVERTVAFKNGDSGFFMTAGAANAFGSAALRNDSFNSNAYGIRILTTFGFATAEITASGIADNSATGVLVDGAQSTVYASRNTGRDVVNCANNGHAYTYKDNSLDIGCTASQLAPQ